MAMDRRIQVGALTAGEKAAIEAAAAADGRKIAQWARRALLAAAAAEGFPVVEPVNPAQAAMRC